MTDTASVIIRAANFAAIKHKEQRRRDPEETPYINHPIGVAHILTSVSTFKRRTQIGIVHSEGCTMYIQIVVDRSFLYQ